MNTKMQTTAWEIIFIKHIPYKGLVIRLHKKENSYNTIIRILTSFTSSVLQMANRIMKKGSTLLVIRKHKTTLVHYYTLTGINKIIKPDKSKYWPEWEATGTLTCCFGKGKIVQPLWGIV